MNRLFKVNFFSNIMHYGVKYFFFSKYHGCLIFSKHHESLGFSKFNECVWFSKHHESCLLFSKPHEHNTKSA